MSCMQAALLVPLLTTTSLYGLPQSLVPTVSCLLRFQALCCQRLAIQLSTLFCFMEKECGCTCLLCKSSTCW